MEQNQMIFWLNYLFYFIIYFVQFHFTVNKWFNLVLIFKMIQLGFLIFQKTLTAWNQFRQKGSNCIGFEKLKNQIESFIFF